MVLSLLLSAFSFAADAPKPTVKMGGVIFAHYGYDLTDGADGYNSFELDRAYLTARGELDDHWATRITLDADHIKAAEVAGESLTVDTKYRVFVKHAYLEWREQKAGVKLRFGMADTAWAPYYDSFWGYRFLGKSAGDEYKVVDTSDLGIQAMGDHNKGLIQWQAGIINGEGYGKLEVDASKTVQARFTVDPLAGGEGYDLPISAFFSQSFLGEGDATTLYGGAVGFKMKYGLAWAEYLGESSGGVSGSIISVSLQPRVPEIVTVVARVDLVDPDGQTTDDGTTRILVGAGHEFLEKVTATATYERTTVQSAPDAPEHGVFLRMQAGF